MTAYELADMVEKEPFHTNLNRNTIALFIRQQSDRIAELEKENELLTAKLNYMFEQEIKSARNL
jgi:hypothetical protein